MAITSFLFKSVAQKQFNRLSSELQNRVSKRFQSIIDNYLESRHLRFGRPFFVEEIGQMRVIYEIKGDIGVVLFIGDHKEYENELRRK